MGKCIMCQHCGSWFFPEEGVSLDDCPKCGRTVGAPPAPAPLPGDDGVMCARLLFACTGHPHALIPWPHRLLHDAVAHISDLTRRLADAEAENGRFAGMLEDSVSGWRKLYTEERAERVRIEGVLLNDVQAERQESDEHIKGLDAVIKTQDKTIRDLKSRVAEAEAERDALREKNLKLMKAIFAARNCGIFGCCPFCGAGWESSDERHSLTCPVPSAKSALAATEVLNA